MATTNGTPRYRLSLAHGVSDQLKAWADVAEQSGLLAEYRAALALANEQLQIDPMGYGDPLRDYHHAGLSERRAMGPWFIVQYAVHVGSHIVFVREFRLNPYSALARLIDGS